MDTFCGTEFWNSNLTWWTTDPDLTSCFEQTVLYWIPCAFVWIFAILETYYMKTSMNKNVPWGFLNISKLCLTIALIAISIADFVLALLKNGEDDIEVFNVDYVMPFVKIITFLLTGALVLLNKKYGNRTSGTLFLFWFFLSICMSFRCRTEVRNRDLRKVFEDGTNHSFDEYKYYSFMVSFGITIALLILNFWADKAPKEKKYYSKRECPELNASFFSRITYSWFDYMAWNGFRRPLTEADLFDLRPVDESKEIMPVFAKYWNKSVRKNQTAEARAKSLQDEKLHNHDSGEVYFLNPKKGTSKRMTSIMPAIYQSFGDVFVFGAFMKLINDLLVFVSPQLLSLIIGFIESTLVENGEAEPLWKGICYALGLFIVASVQTLTNVQYMHRMATVGIRIRTALNNAIYRKSLVISNSTRKESTVGEIVNLMAVDAQRFFDLVQFINLIWSAPLQITLALVFLWFILGPSVLAGLAVLIILIPINGFIAARVKTLQVKQMKCKDDRVKMMNEILSGIKVLKLYAWEPSFEERVMQIRQKEIDTLTSAAYLNAGTSFLWACAPFLVSLVTFATYVMIDENNVLDASTAFVSLSLFNILRMPLGMLPMMISNLIQTQVSITRINKFMNSEELDPNNVEHDKKHESTPVIIKNGAFSWGDEDTTLKNIDIEVKKESLVAIVGAVGSGKTSLISSILGEMDKISGRVNTLGRIAYVPQQAWIQNCTVRDNILFGKPYDKKKYNRVIDACALKADIDMLSGGDQCEIGEKGINLSGGQKQRISLARAVYSDADIYLFDDPLSAVDAHVGRHIFDNVIGPKGILPTKTRILVTHGITYLPQTDNIYVVKLGEISESGTYQQLLENKGAFAEFLIQHIQEAASEDEDLDQIKQQLESTVKSEELLGKLERAITLARAESLSDSVSVRSFGSDNKGSLRRRKSRHNSILSTTSSVNEQKIDGKLIDEETSQTGGVKFIVYKHYFKSIGVFLVIATLILNTLFQGFSIGSNIWLTQWSNDETVADDTSKRDLYLGVYGAFGIGQAITVYFAFLTISLGCIASSIEMHHVLMTYVFRWPLEIFDITPLGRILNRFSKDIDVIDNTMPHLWRVVISQFFMVLATLIVISVSTPIFLAVVVPIAVLYYFVQRFYVSTSRQLMRLESVTRSPIYSHFSETITGVSSIRAYHVNQRFVKISDDRVDLNQSCKYPSIIANRWLAMRLEMIGNLVILFAALFAVLGGQQNPGLVGLSITYSLQITQTLNWLVRMSSDVETNIVSVERIKEYDEIKQEAAWNIENSTLPKEWPQSGQVTFDDFKVRYREGLDLVLKGISFKIIGGEKVGIVGRTGAGKSSLTLALFRIIESAGGKIMIDGVDIASLGLHDLRSRLTIIPQDPVLYSGTLRMNLDPFNAKTDDEIWKALELAHLKAFAKSLAAGLNHEVSEGGDNLSVGQRQLVCLARALLRKTKVLVLDEATAAVDLETDDLIQKTIRIEFKDCTVLTIAHRLNTIIDSDKVIVLDQGIISEFASPAELLADKNSTFYSMAKESNLV